MKSLRLLLAILFPATLFAATDVIYTATADPNLNPDGSTDGSTSIGTVDV